MKKIYQLIFLFAALFIYNGCSESDENVGGLTNSFGRLKLDVTADVRVMNVDESGDSISLSRSDASFDPISAMRNLTKSDLKITLTTPSGETKSWDSADDFPEDEDFPIGQYTFTASYGLEGEEGIDQPYLYGESSFSVKESAENIIGVRATVQNSLTTVSYTDHFKQYFSSYSNSLTTSTGTVFNLEENQTLYHNPGKATLGLTVTLPSGKTATTSLGTFDTYMASLQNINIDVNTDEGEIKLEVTFDDSFDSTDPIILDITEDFTDAEPPLVTLDGFNPEIPIVYYEGNSKSIYEDDIYVFNIAAKGGMEKVLLELFSNGNVIESYDALKSSERESLSALGVKMIGVNNNSIFGKVDITGWLNKLNANRTSVVEYTVRLTVTDRLQQSSDVTSAGSDNIKLSINPENSMLVNENTGVGTSTFTLRFDTTMDDLDEKPQRLSLITGTHLGGTDKLTFKATQRSNAASNDFPYTYDLEIQTPGYILDFYVKGESALGYDCKTINLTRPEPKLLPYDEGVNVYAQSITVTFILEEPEKDRILFQNLILNEKLKITVSNNDSKIEYYPSIQDFDAEKGIVSAVINELKDDTEYNAEIQYNEKELGSQKFKTPVKAPAIQVISNEIDWYSKYITAKIKLLEPKKKDVLETLMQEGKVTYTIIKDDQVVSGPNQINKTIGENNELDLVVTGLEPGNEYVLRVVNDTELPIEIPFTTEGALQLPSFDFDQPNNVWGTNNPMTTQCLTPPYGDGNIKGAKGTSYDNDGRLYIQTVGWGEGNDATQGSYSMFGGTTPFTWVCQHSDAGLLHLGNNRQTNSDKQGTVDFSDVEQYGLELNSRPCQINFGYQYTAKYSGDRGYYIIKLYDADKNRIYEISEELTGSGTKNISLSAEVVSMMSYIYVRFQSTNNQSCLVTINQSINPSLTNQNPTYSNNYLDCPTYSNKSTTSFTGSKLYIDGIELIYGDAPQQ